jgi:transposase
MFCTPTLNNQLVKTMSQQVYLLLPPYSPDLNPIKANTITLYNTRKHH